MNHRYTIFLLVVLFLFSCNRKSVNPLSKSDLQTMNLKGEIEKILEIHFDAEIKFGETVKSRESFRLTYLFNKKGNILSKKKEILRKKHVEETTFKYDKNDNIIEENFFRGDNRLTERRKYTFNDFNKISEINYYYGDGALNIRWDFVYDKNQSLVKKNEYDPKGVLQKTYGYKTNSRDLIIREMVMKPDLTMIEQSTYNYDPQGRLVEKSTFGSDGRHYTKWMTRYNESGLIFEKLFFDERQAVLRFYTQKTVFHYNDHEDLIRKEVYNSDRILSETWDYIYTYDSKNNWTTCKEYLNRVPKEIIERKISYK